MFSRRIYKNSNNVVKIKNLDYRDNTVFIFFTKEGMYQITKSFQEGFVECDKICFLLSKDELSFLEDGVIYVEINDGCRVRQFNTDYVLKTPKDYEPIEYPTVEKVKELISENVKPFETISKIEDYLYEIDYNVIDYNYAKEYFKSKNVDVNSAGCSVMRAGNLVGRNLDWQYNYEENAVIKTEKNFNRHSVIGIAGGFKDFTKEFVESEEIGDVYKILPFYLQDGMNDAGLFAEMNVVNYDGNDVINPTEEERDEICSLMLVRYILDHFTTTSEAVEYLQKYVKIYNPSTLTELGYELHYFLSDENGTTTIEFKNNEIVVIEDVPFLTNFKIFDVDFNDDRTVYSPASVVDGDLPSSQNIKEFDTGLERWNELVQRDITDKQDLITAMNDVNFSNAYTKGLDRDFWYSEFVGGDITVDTPYDDDDFQERCQYYKDAFERTTREDGDFWITRHQAIYDHDEKVLEVAVEEGDVYHRFSFGDEQDLSDYYTKAETNTLLAGKQDTLIAGENIVISGNTISAVGGGGGITSGEVATMIEDRVSGFEDTTVEALLELKEEKVTEEYVDEAIEAETARTESTYLKEHQSLDGYATEDYVDEAIQNKVSSTTVGTIWRGTLAEYQALSTHDDNTIYFIKD